MEKKLSLLAKLLLIGAGGLAAVAGPILWLFPSQTHTYFAWTIGNPMTPVFMGANYFGGIGALWAVRSNRWSVARVLMPGIFTFGITQLLATLFSIPIFNWHHPVAWAWLFVYLVSPGATLLVYFLEERGYQPPAYDPSSIPGIFRPVMLVFALISAFVGVLLWVWPYNLSTTLAGSAVPWWGWSLTPLTAHVVGGWFLAAAALYATLSRPHSPQAVRIGLIGVIAATALEVLGGIIHWSAFNGPTITALLYMLNAASACAFGIFTRLRTKASPPAPVSAEPA
jgi:hypothetical protein